MAQGAGRIGSRYVSEVGFEVGGRVLSRDVDVGAIVRKGQKLAELSAIDYQNKVSAAEADLAAANAALTQAAAQEQRFRILLAKGFATHSQYDDALKALQSTQAAVQATEANLRIAQNQLGYTQLEAPDDGIVTATGADPGQVVVPGQMVVEISRNDAREAIFAVAGDDIPQARLGMAVSVSLQGRSDIAVTGTIREISPEADRTTGTTRSRWRCLRRLWRCASDQSWSAASKPKATEAAILPPGALLQSGDKPQVWVVGKDDKVERRQVQLAKFDGDSVVVSHGLSAGEKVVIAGVNSLADGQLVKPETEVE